MDIPQDEIDRVCGKIIREWALLESVLGLYYLAFVGAIDQFRARVVWASLANLQARRKALNRYSENFLESDELRCFRILMKRMSKLANKRNMVAHARCYPKGRNLVFMDFDKEGDDGTFLFLKEIEEQFNTVKNWPDAIAKLTADLLEFYPRLERQHTWSKMHRGQQDDRGPNSGPHQQESTPAKH